MSTTDVRPFCNHDCPLRNYRSNSVRSRTLPSYQPYVPAASPVYKPIRNFQIRLLCLQPGYGTDQINVTLSPALLSAHATTAILEPEYGERIEVEYTTLSYSWGYGGRTVEVVCNGRPFVITHSLETALRHVRHPHEVLYLWVDAICIQQASLEEKSVQVQKMFAIYSKASMTIAWLGLESECNGQSLAFLRNYDSNFRHSEYCRNGLEALSSDLKQLAERPWFRRTWVRQEVYASRNLQVQASAHRISWHQFKSSLSQLRKVADEFDLVNPGNLVNRIGLDVLRTTIDALIEVDVAQANALAARDIQHLEKKAFFSLERMLRGSNDFQATDHKDYVYAILSMTAARTTTASSSPEKEKENRACSLRIDYGQTETQTFADTVVYLMKYHNSLDPLLLAYVSKRGAEASAAGNILPSWVPDWSRIPRWSVLDFIAAAIDGPMAFETGNQRPQSVATADSESKDYSYQRRPILISGTTSDLYVPDMKYKMYHKGRFEPFEEARNLKFACEGFHLGSISMGLRGANKLMSKLRLTKVKQSSDVGNGALPYTSSSSNNINSNINVNSDTLIIDQGPRFTDTEWRGFFEYLQSQQGGFTTCSFEPSKESTLPNIQYAKTKRTVKGSMHMFEDVLASKHLGISSIRKSLQSDGNATKLYAPVTVQSGDQVVILRSMSMPAVLRATGNPASGSEYVLVGPLISDTYIEEEMKRIKDLREYFPAKRNQKPDFKPWEHLGPLKEDLILRQYILV